MTVTPAARLRHCHPPATAFRSSQRPVPKRSGSRAQLGNAWVTRSRPAGSPECSLPGSRAPRAQGPARFLAALRRRLDLTTPSTAHRRRRSFRAEGAAHAVSRSITPTRRTRTERVVESVPSRRRPPPCKVGSSHKHLSAYLAAVLTPGSFYRSNRWRRSGEVDQVACGFGLALGTAPRCARSASSRDISLRASATRSSSSKLAPRAA
jgi:hypothetical protein